MNNFGSLFESLYRQFILRDLFAKIMPGFIAIIMTQYFLRVPLRVLAAIGSELVFWQWLFLFAFAWIVGFILQHAGIITGFLIDKTYEVRKQKNNEELNRRFSLKAHILEFAGDDFKKALERTIVIKEACGNTLMAFIYSILLLPYRVVCDLLYRPHTRCLASLLMNLFILSIMVVSAWVLHDAHVYHADREQFLRDSYIS